VTGPQAPKNRDQVPCGDAAPSSGVGWDLHTEQPRHVGRRHLTAILTDGKSGSAAVDGARAAEFVQILAGLLEA
jgi:hypothetical protein